MPLISWLCLSELNCIKKTFWKLVAAFPNIPQLAGSDSGLRGDCQVFKGFFKKSRNWVLVSYHLSKSVVTKIRNQRQLSGSLLLNFSFIEHTPFSVWNDEWTCVKILSHHIIMNCTKKYSGKIDEWRFQHFLTSECLLLLLDQCVSAAWPVCLC